MKNILMLSAVAVLLAGATVYAGGYMHGTMDGSGNKIITNEELPTITPDQDTSTMNVMPPEKSAEGANPGGLRSDSEEWKSETDLKTEPAEPEGKKPDKDYFDRDIYRPEY